ncbi:MAG: ribonuclease HII [Gammaproteobacteria bacterium]|nr:ribonuclease HII [Gammaproteobacteria bacterium]MCP5138924.1 ribonuclease HII [Chromatiales bacterium]
MYSSFTPNNPGGRATTVAGIDEAGRGPLAGAVVAAAVVLTPGQVLPGVRDSKQLSAARREALVDEIRSSALAWCIGVATHAEIDSLNILHATMLAMSRAFAGLGMRPDLVQIDGNRAPRFDGFTGTVETVIGGDRSCPAISAASILAKVHRDQLMMELHVEYPGYGFDRHKGYPTAEHRAALLALGPCPAHRRSFAPVRAALTGARRPVELS